MKKIFVHSDIDDAGLSPHQFRVYAHLARRSNDRAAWPAISSIARVCRMDQKSVRAAIKALVERGFLSVTERPGKTSLYRLSASLVLNEDGAGENGAPLAKGTTHPGPDSCQMALGNPSQMAPEEDTPRRRSPEDNPISEGELLPFDSSEFQEAWKEWVKHKRELKKPLTPTSQRAQIKRLAGMGEARAIAAIQHSIENGWQGIFEAKPIAANASFPQSNRHNAYVPPTKF